MKLTITGDIAFAEDFWDCECEWHYIHRKALVPSCLRCGFRHEDSPDSRLWEVLQEAPDLLTIEEYKEIITWLMEHSSLS